MRRLLILLELYICLGTVAGLCNDVVCIQVSTLTVKTTSCRGLEPFAKLHNVTLVYILHMYLPFHDLK